MDDGVEAVIADNALSHPGEIAPLEALLRRDLTAGTTIPVGKGELVARRPGNSAESIQGLGVSVP